MSYANNKPSEETSPDKGYAKFKRKTENKVGTLTRKTTYFYHNYLFLGILILILIVVVGLIFVGAVTFAFKDVGFSSTTAVLILVGTLAGSLINIPLTKLKTTIPMVTEETASYLGIVYKIPRVEFGCAETTVAINVGGGLIPTAVSFYLLWKVPSTLIYCLVGIAIVAIITRAVAKPVKGVGIVTPAFIPPIAAAIIAYVLMPTSPKIVAYVAGTLGTLIGADLTNLRGIPKLGAPVASIGGAGTFDGIFLAGIIAVLLV